MSSNYHSISAFFRSWWWMFIHLFWSIVDRTEEFERLAFVDHTSEILAQVFVAVFLVIGVILLINMLIALLSNTYTRTEVRL